MKGYIKLLPRSKKPMEKWRDPQNQYTLEELADWDGNIGWLCGTENIVVLDIDRPDIVNELCIKFFDTRAVKTGSGGYHLWYRVPNAKKVVIFDKTNTHLGELQALGTYVVCPPSIHPNGTSYKVLNPDQEILDITQEELLSPFRGVCRLSDESIQPKVNWVPTGNQDDPFDKVLVEDVWGAKVNDTRGNQLFCTHPMHGSGTGHNLVINPSKNVWKCWRCNSGGGAAMAVAVRYGVLDCSDARRGMLRGDKYKETLRIAREKGFIRDEQTVITRTPIKKVIIDE